MNRVILIGRLTRDPELKFLPGNGKAMSKFTLAVNRQFKKDEADFINCVAFDKIAETISQYCTKGSSIALTGNIRTGSYQAQDGSKRYTTDVTVESFEFCSSKNSNQNSNGNNNNLGDVAPIDDGEMPF